MKKFLSGLAVFLVLFTGCPNTVEKTLPPNLNYADEEEYEEDVFGKSITFADPLLSGETIAAKTEAGTVSFPATGGPWQAEFIDGPGATHNAKFDIKYEYDSEDTEKAAPIKAALVVKEALEWGRYSVRVKISNKSGAAYKKAFAFEVTLTPAPFKDPPRMYPYPEGVKEGENQKNKMVIKWDKRSGITKYTVYVGASDDFDAATTYKLAEIDGSATELKAEMTAFPPSLETGGDLPDGKKYWAWVTAENALGVSPPSPAAWKQTTSPMQAYFYENIDDKGVAQAEASYFDGGGYGDYYRFTPTTIKYWGGSVGPYNYLGDVVYHEIYDPVRPGSNWPFPDSLKNNPDVIGYPAGVFVIKYREGRVPPSLTSNDKTPGKQKRYSAVYYWGMGARSPDNAVNHAGKVQAGVVNQWAGYAETVTYEEAIDKFTAAAVGKFLHLMPEPYYKHFSDDMSGNRTWETWIGEGAYHPSPAP
ncbi:MAG: hypothetical protein LBC53_06805 [Spirochaetaceae bacterium]|nr:hypothetical protein [Spirochaetaceae bacterium]